MRPAHTANGGGWLRWASQRLFRALLTCFICILPRLTEHPIRLSQRVDVLDGTLDSRWACTPQLRSTAPVTEGGTHKHLHDCTGNDRWRTDPDCTYFNARELQHRVDLLRQRKDSCDTRALMFSLRSELLRNISGLGHPKLHNTVRTPSHLLTVQSGLWCFFVRPLVWLNQPAQPADRLAAILCAMYLSGP